MYETLQLGLLEQSSFPVLCHSLKLSMLGRGALVEVMSKAVQSRSCSTASEWGGMTRWRFTPTDDRRIWGRNTCAVETRAPWRDNKELVSKPESRELEENSWRTEGFGESKCDNLASWGSLVLNTSDPLEKAFLTHQAYRLWSAGKLSVGVAVPPEKPGRPSKPELVPPRQVPSAKESRLTPSAHLMHNLAHIELNAIDLAWDTVVRFSSASEELGTQFFADFAHVADDESRHFRWCLQRLTELGFSYGDMPAHNLLWKDCMKTSASVTSRLAVIPMMQEARGLDAGPRLAKKLLGFGDLRSAAIVRRIGSEEVAHVAVGVTWFLDVCQKLGLDPALKFKELMVECDVELRGPFNHDARARAGLPRDWYDQSAVEDYFSSNTKQVGQVKLTSESSAAAEDKQQVHGTENLLSKPSDQLKVVPSVSSIQPASYIDSDSSGLPADASQECSSSLPAVYERLALLVSMESKTAGT